MGIGTSSHLSMEMFESMTGTKLSPVHYKGGAPALADVIGGHVPIVFLSTTLTAQPAKAGELRILGLGSTQRLAQFPDLPTVAETGSEAMNQWSGSGLSRHAETPKRDCGVA